MVRALLASEPEPGSVSRPRGQPLAAGEQRNVFPFLRFVAGEKDVIGAERIVGGDGEADGAVDGGEFFDGQRVIDVAEACAAVLRREDDAEQAHCAELLDGGDGELAGLVPRRDVGCDLARGEVADLAAQVFLFFSQYEWVEALRGFHGGLHLRLLWTRTVFELDALWIAEV